MMVRMPLKSLRREMLRIWIKALAGRLERIAGFEGTGEGDGT